jgi:hypothetical protein
VCDIGSAQFEDLGCRHNRLTLFVPEMEEGGDSLGGGVALIEREQLHFADHPARLRLASARCST